MADTNAAPKKRSKPDWGPRFLKVLAKKGIILRACKAARIDRGAFYRRRNSDPVFAEEVAKALKDAGDLMEEEARRRGLDGSDRPVYYRGKKCGTIREYSDTLLIFLLKAHDPARFRENVRHEHSGPEGGPIPHEHSITNRIDELTRAFEGAADRASEGRVSSNGTG